MVDVDDDFPPYDPYGVKYLFVNRIDQILNVVVRQALGHVKGRVDIRIGEMDVDTPDGVLVSKNCMAFG